MAKRKHPFHWSVYSPLSDQLSRIANDERIDQDVGKLIAEANHKLWQAWDLQAENERRAETKAAPRYA